MNDEQYKKSLLNKALEKLKQKWHKETDEDRKALRTTIRKDLDKDERVAYMKANNIWHYGHSGFKDMFPLLLDECFSQKKPSKIVIMVKCINDHFTTEWRSALIGKEVADGLSKDEWEKQTAQALAELIKKNTSFTGEVIIRSPYEFSSNEDDENTRYINDRHNEALSVSNATILRLPCINMIEDMAKYNLSEATAPDTESLTNYAFLDINETIEQAIEFEMW